MTYGSVRAIECAAFTWFPGWLAAGVGDHQKQVTRLLMMLLVAMLVAPGRASGRRSNALRDTLLSLFQSHQL